MTTRIDDLYEADFYAWSKEQAKALRCLQATRPNIEIDWRHLIEEVRDLGKSERNTVRSHLRIIIEHLLKLRHSPAVDPRTGWRSTIARARSSLADSLSPSLLRDARQQLPQLYHQTRGVTAMALAEHGEQIAADALPETCPWTLDQLVAPDWWPTEPPD